MLKMKINVKHYMDTICQWKTHDSGMELVIFVPEEHCVQELHDHYVVLAFVYVCVYGSDGVYI